MTEQKKLANATFMATLGNAEWMAANVDKLKALVPAAWTPVAEINGLKIGFSLKLLGIDWRSEAEFGKVMTFLTKIGLIEMKNGTMDSQCTDAAMLRSSPSYTFNPELAFTKD